MTANAPGFSEARLDRIGAVGRRYVDDDKLPCSVVQVCRDGELIYRDVYGKADVERDVDATEDTIFRIYSMTKPITSIVLMQLYEEGELLLEDPVAAYLPEFADVEVFVDPTRSRAPERAPTVRDMLTHTSGLTYGFLRQHELDAMYRERSLGDFGTVRYSLSECMAELASLPLLFDPGTSWNYSMSTDVCGAIIEAITGTTLDVAFADRVLGPLGMHDTDFWVPQDKADRFAALYVPNPSGGMMLFDDPTTSSYLEPAPFLSGGGGLASTLGDYQRFLDALAGGGEANGVRIIGRKTLEYMTINHLPGGQLLNDLGQSLFAEVAMEGMGFGLGFSVMEKPAANGTVSSVGEFAWGGAASTAFWVDPVEKITALFLTQLLPSSTYPIRRELRGAVYQALL